MAKMVGFEPTRPCRPIAFRVFYSQHTLADFEKKCPILRVNAIVRKKMIFSPLRAASNSSKCERTIGEN